VVESDENAVGFFEKMGLRKTGVVESRLSPSGRRVMLETTTDSHPASGGGPGIYLLAGPKRKAGHRVQA
jgi:hypothetical protein